MTESPDNIRVPSDEHPDERASRPQRRTDTAQAIRTREFVIEAANHLLDLHRTDVVIFDVRGKSDLSDYIIIGSGSSDRQIRSVSRDLEKVAADYDLQKFGRDIDAQASWVVTDFVEVIVHLFDPAARAHYDLEMMWGDAPRVDFRIPGRIRKNPQSHTTFAAPQEQDDDADDEA